MASPVPAHFRATHASPLIFFSTGLPPLAFEKCLQSGLNHASPTRRPATSVLMFTFQTLSHRCLVWG